MTSRLVVEIHGDGADIRIVHREPRYPDVQVASHVVDALTAKNIVARYNAHEELLAAVELAIVHFDEAIRCRRPTTAPLEYVAILRAAVKAGLK